MKSTPNAAASARNTNAGHPPLARNAQGDPIALPEGTASFAIKRETRGRPKAIKGPDGHLYRLPLSSTKQDIADTFGPGPYRLDALDALGNMLDYVTTIEISGDESDDVIDDDRASSVGRGRGPVSDLRFALEAITEMARAQADSIRAVSEAQADWVKGLASAKALPRNAGYALSAPAPENNDDEDDGDEADDSDAVPPEPPPPPLPPWVAVAQAAAAQAAETIARNAAPAVEAWFSKTLRRNGAADAVEAPTSQPSAPTPPEATPTAPSPPTSRNPMVHLAEINAGLTNPERDFLGRVLRSRGGDVLTAELLARNVDDAIDYVRSVMAEWLAQRERARQQADRGDTRDVVPPRESPSESPSDLASGTGATAPSDAGAAAGFTPEFVRQVVAVGLRLDADQRAAVLALLPRLAPERIEELKALLVAMEPDAAAAWVRENLELLCAEVES